MAKRKLAKASKDKTSPRKKTSWIFWGIAGGVGAVIIAVVVYMAFEAARAPEVAVGKPAPDFTLKLFNGQSLALSSVKGKPILLNFWSST
jgi:cytochrome c biogenesis protein CcmG/thiol:disulfide interchange protein DsbE